MKGKKTPPPRWRFQRLSEGIYRDESSNRYFARFRHKGTRVFERLGTKAYPCTSLPEAKRQLRELKNRLDKTEVNARKFTLHHVIEQRRKTTIGAEGTKAYKLDYLDKFKDAFKSTVKVGDVTTHDLRLFLKDYEELAPATQNHIITVLREVFQTATDLKSIDTSPMLPIKYRKLGDGKKRLTPSVERFEAIVASIRSQPLADTAKESGDLVEFMGLAGLGQGECAGLRWQDIDLGKEGTIVVIRQKTKKQFTIPLYPQLRGLLERMNAERKNPDPEDNVFSVRNPKKALQSACKRLKFPDYTARSLRRMFIRQARERGVPVQFVARWQGHKDVKMVMKIYDEPTDEQGMKFAALMGETTVNNPS